MAFTLRTILLALAVILFVITVFDDNFDWLAWGLAALAAAFLVAEMGWDRTFGGTAARDRDRT